MKARSILVTLALVGCGMAMAQENRFSVGLELGIPVGDFGDATSLGIGGTLGYEIPMGDNLGLIIQAGYMSFMGKSIDLGPLGSADSPNWAVIPAQVGAKYYFTDNQEGFYAMALLGIHNTSVTYPGYTQPGIPGLTPDVVVADQTFSDTNLSFAPGIGYIVGENIDLALRYQIITTEGSSLSYLGLRAAYMFGSR